jgi:hypothetical protein
MLPAAVTQLLGRNRRMALCDMNDEVLLSIEILLYQESLCSKLEN